MGKGLYVVSIFAVLISYALGCSVLELGARASGKEGDEYDTDDRKVYYSQVVVWGEVVGNATGKATEDYPMNNIPGVYTIEFNVICTYKGGPIPSTIFIAGTGNMNKEVPECPSAPLSKSKEHVMFLKKTNLPEVFEIEFKPNNGASDVILDDLSIVCGLSLSEDDYDNTICGDFPPLSKEDGCEEWTPRVVSTEAPATSTLAPKKPVSTKKVIDINDNNNHDDKNNQSDQGYETKTDGDTKTGSKTGQVQDNPEGGATATVATAVLIIVSTVLAVLV